MRRLDGPPPTRALVVALVLASGVVMTVDHHGGADPARAVVGGIVGPVESVASAAVRPLTGAPEWFRGKDDLQDDIDALTLENAQLREQVATSAYDANKLAEYEGLTATAANLGYSLVPARVIAYGAAQSFARTVTIDAGSDAGLAADMTVVNADGLVGRVLRTTAGTSTVLLIVDADSVVGGRVGSSMEVGFLHGRGSLGRQARLDLELVDSSTAPRKDDPVVTWGSQTGGPYVSGVPVGTVKAVYASLRETSQRVVIDPYVDFGSLDLVGVVVPTGTRSDRGVIEADGTLPGVGE